MPKKISLQDIAGSLGISRGTVDRAIHNRGRISPETRERVLTEARRLGYIDRKINSFLPLQHRCTVKAVVPSGDPFFGKIEDGMVKAVNEMMPRPDLEIIPIQIDEPDEQKAWLDEAAGRADEIDGILLIPSDQQFLDDSINAVDRAGIRLATLNTDAPGSRRSFFIGQNPYASGRTAGELMMRMNPGSVIVISGFRNLWAHSGRLEGFLDVYREAGNESLIQEIYYAHDDMSETGRILNQHSSGCGGIYSVSGICTEGSGKYLARAGQHGRVLVGFDCTGTNIELLKSGCITSLISQSPELQGYLAVRQLLKIIRDDSDAVQEDFTIPIDIYFRENIDFYRNNLEL